MSLIQDVREPQDLTENDITWLLKEFHGLSTLVLYELLTLRSEIFVVEQACSFLDLDGLDLYASHMLGWRGRRLVTCARILPVDIFEPGFVSIGRVAVARDFRGQGIGRTLVKRVLDAIAANGSTAPIKIIAQEYLEAFYRSFGFKTVGRAFLHDGQPHVPMVKI